MRNKHVDIVFPEGELELMDALNRYRRSLGWTWKRMMIVGLAEAAAKQGDNPELVLALVNHLENRR
jgi:hypothetical protein